jgi:hypothetical protein
MSVANRDIHNRTRMSPFALINPNENHALDKNISQLGRATENLAFDAISPAWRSNKRKQRLPLHLSI